MKENKNNEVVKYLLENYDIKDVNDIADALKDMFKDTIQTMMNAEFNSSMGYEKSDNKIEKTNYRNDYSTKNVKSKFGEFELSVPRDRNAEFEPQIVPKNKRDISGIEEKVKQKWNSTYPTSLKAWEDNWEAICTLFNYSKELRKVMYTTNAIESLNRSYRKYTKTKGVFISDNSLMKCLYLSTKTLRKNGLLDILIGI
jgi:transposase-like protein